MFGMPTPEPANTAVGCSGRQAHHQFDLGRQLRVSVTIGTAPDVTTIAVFAGSSAKSWRAADRRSDNGREQSHQRPALVCRSSSRRQLQTDCRTAYCDAKRRTTLCQPQSDHSTAIVEPAKRGLAHSSSPASGAVPM